MSLLALVFGLGCFFGCMATLAVIAAYLLRSQHQEMALELRGQEPRDLEQDY